MRFPNVIGMARYRELLECAPPICEADYANLATFWPVYPRLRQFVNMALYVMRNGRA